MNTELLQVESRYWDSMKDRDPREAEELTGEDCILVGAQGVMAVSGEMVAKMLEDGSWNIDRYTLDESKAQVRMIRDDIAIVAYPVHEELNVEGKKVALDAFDSTVWVKKNGKWVTVLHTESLAGDPFGRDKKKPAQRTAKAAPKRKAAAKKKRPVARKTSATKRTRARAR
jgi:hypothetical protein